LTAAQQAAREAAAQACLLEGGADTRACAQAAARRWRWADGLAARQPEAQTRLADAHRLWRHEDATAAPPPAGDLARFVRRARRRGALPGWWELDECADDALLGADTAPASAAQLAAARGYSDVVVSSLRTLASEVYGRAPSAPQPSHADDSESEDALSEDGSLVDAEEVFPAAMYAARSEHRGRAQRVARREADGVALRALMETKTAYALSADGAAAYTRGDYGAALLLFSAALAHPRADFGVVPRHVLLCARSQVFAKLRRWRRALADADAAADAAPGFFKAKLRRAAALAGQGRTAAACIALARRQAVDVATARAAGLVSRTFAAAHTQADTTQLLAGCRDLLLLRPRAEHCDAVLRHVAPHLADFGSEFVRACFRYSAACVAAGGAAAADEFAAAGGCTAARVLVGIPGTPLHALIDEASALCDTVQRHAADPAAVRLRRTEDFMSMSSDVFSDAMPMCMAAHFLDARGLVAAMRCRDLQPHLAWHAATAAHAAMQLGREREEDEHVAVALARAGATEALMDLLVAAMAPECAHPETMEAVLCALTLLAAPHARAAAARDADADAALLKLVVRAAQAHGLRAGGRGDPELRRSVCEAACTLLTWMLGVDAVTCAPLAAAHAEPPCEELGVVTCIAYALSALQAHGGVAGTCFSVIGLLVACVGAGGTRCAAFICARGGLAHLRRALRCGAADAAAQQTEADVAARTQMCAVCALQVLAAKSRGLSAACAHARMPEAMLAAAARATPLVQQDADMGTARSLAVHLSVSAALCCFVPFAARLPRHAGGNRGGTDWLPHALRHAVRMLLTHPRSDDICTTSVGLATVIAHADAAGAHALHAWADTALAALSLRVRPGVAAAAAADAEHVAQVWEQFSGIARASLEQHARAGTAAAAAVTQPQALARYGVFAMQGGAGDPHADDEVAVCNSSDAGEEDAYWEARFRSDPVALAANDEVLCALPPDAPDAEVEAALRRCFCGDEDAAPVSLPVPVPARAQGRGARRRAPAAAAAAPMSEADAATARAAADAAMAALLAEDDAAAEKAEKAKAKARAKKQRQKAGKQGAEGDGGAGPSSQATDADAEEDVPAAVAAPAPAAAAAPPPAPAPAPAAPVRAAAAHRAAPPATALPPPPQQQPSPPAPMPSSQQQPAPRLQHNSAAALPPPQASLLPPLAPLFPAAPLPLPAAAAAAELASGADDDLQELLAHLQLSAPPPAVHAHAPPLAKVLPAQQPEEEEEEAEECVVCMCAPPSARLSPCGHAAMCGACTARVMGAAGNGLCPMCRARIVSFEDAC
jgi:hypothetical protein